jgi:hypothetical protein
MFSRFKAFVAGVCMLALAGCGGGGGGGTPFVGGGGGNNGNPSVSVGLSNTVVSSAAPVTVTATVKTGTGQPAANVVVNFAAENKLGAFSAPSALTDANGVATVTLNPASVNATGADTVIATAKVGETEATGRVGFSLVATTAAITSFTASAGSSADNKIAAYGQTVLTLKLSGVSTQAPANLAFSSPCVTNNKATLSATTVTATSDTVVLTYKDTGGCGSTVAVDTVTASISGTSTQQTVQLHLSSPAVNNIVFINATPEVIYLKGSGLTTSSKVVFQVNDAAGNPLPNQVVKLGLSTFTGGLTIEGKQEEISQQTDGKGQVSALVNSGTVPTPVRVIATLGNIQTVSSNLAVAVGLPSQLNFSLAQTTKNIEGYDRDGTPNQYQILAADRSGNPVPDGTTINYWAEGGQIASTSQTQLADRLARSNATFVSQAPRPLDGRITIVAYALGEESFVDVNGNNVYDIGEPFQDLGDITKDILYDFNYDALTDEYVSLAGLAAGSQACKDFSSAYPPLALIPPADLWIPVRPNTCDGIWTQRTYVRRAIETVLSTTAAGALWDDTSGLASTCRVIEKQTGPSTATRTKRVAVGGSGRSEAWYTGTPENAKIPPGSLYFTATDDNPIRYNPMAAGTVITATSSSKGLSVTAFGTPVASTLNPFPAASVGYQFADDADYPGVFTLSFRSPASQVATLYTITINRGVRPSVCPQQ